MPTLDPNLEPRRDTMCLLEYVSNILCPAPEAALPDVRGDNISMTGVGMSQNKLDQIVSVLIACDYGGGQKSNGEWKLMPYCR